jgi:hypothetical protein
MSEKIKVILDEPKFEIVSGSEQGNESDLDDEYSVFAGCSGSMVTGCTASCAGCFVS